MVLDVPKREPENRMLPIDTVSQKENHTQTHKIDFMLFASVILYFFDIRASLKNIGFHQHI